MMAKLLYYLVLYPLSLLPLPILFGLSKVFLFIIYNVFGYRKKVVFQNLRNAFPDKSETEIKDVARKFYTHFGQLAMEGLKGFSISEKELLQRYKFTNPELVEAFYKQGKSVLLVSGHYNNWEFLVQSLDLQFSYQGAGVGKPITNHGFGALMDNARKRFGNEIWDSTNVRNEITEYQAENKLFACMLLADQSTSNTKKSFWMQFLNQNTPVLFGPEKLATTYNLPVLYYDVIKVKPGFYELTLQLVSENPREEAYGDITYNHNKMLEATITAKPEFWLWSHKRWKHSAEGKDFNVRV